MLDNKKKDKKMKNKFFSLFLAMVLVFSFSIVYISVRGDINKDNKSIHSISTIKPSIVVEKMVRTTTSNWKENVSQYICGIVRFNITICNVGTYYLFDITVNDRIPGNLLYIGNATVDGEPFEPNVDDMNLTWFLLPHEKYPIGPGGSRYIEFDARVKASGTGTNIVEVDAFEEGETEPLSVHANDTSNVTGINHGIVVKKMIWNGDNWSERVDAKPGDIVTFNITVNNTGNVDFNDTSIVDMLPVSMFEYVHNSAKVNGVVQNPEVKEANLTWYNDSLLPFEKIEVIFNALFIKSNIVLDLIN